jgi:hypothetical protein
MDIGENRAGLVAWIFGIDLNHAGRARLQRAWFARYEILAREFIVYDALYAECQRRTC